MCRRWRRRLRCRRCGCGAAPDRIASCALRPASPASLPLRPVFKIHVTYQKQMMIESIPAAFRAAHCCSQPLGAACGIYIWKVNFKNPQQGLHLLQLHVSSSQSYSPRRLRGAARCLRWTRGPCCQPRPRHRRMCQSVACAVRLAASAGALNRTLRVWPHAEPCLRATAHPMRSSLRPRLLQEACIHCIH